MQKQNKESKLANLLASTARCAASMGANSSCAFIYHQPKLPNNVKKMRKF